MTKKDIDYVFLLGDFAIDHTISKYGELEDIEQKRSQSIPKEYSEYKGSNLPTYVKGYIPLENEWMDTQGNIIYQASQKAEIQVLGYHNRIFFKNTNILDTVNVIDSIEYKTIYGSPMLIRSHTHLGILGVYQIKDSTANIEYEAYESLEETSEECLHDINCINYYKEQKAQETQKRLKEQKAKEAQKRREAVLLLAKPDANAHRYASFAQMGSDAQLGEWLVGTGSGHGTAR